MSSLELEVDGLSRRYGTVTALDGLTFGVPAGQVFGFLGPNGAGKTTTMRAIFGVTSLDAGEIRWRGRPVDQAARRTFGYMPEERGLYPGMRLLEQVEYFALLHDVPGPDARRRSRCRCCTRPATCRSGRLWYRRCCARRAPSGWPGLPRGST